MSKSIDKYANSVYNNIRNKNRDALQGRRENIMTYRQVKNEIKKLVVEKGLNNIYNRDLNEIHHRTGASYSDMDNALNYFRFSSQAAKYRTK